MTFQPSTGLVPLIINNVVNAAVCDPGCANCSSINTASCINCKSGYVLGQNNICVPCTYPCLTCAAATPQTCLSCYGNLVLSGNTCTTCTSSSNCLTCSSTNVTQCTSCPNGLSLNNGVCSGTCPVNCLACSSSTVCIQCISGFAIGASGVCLPCVSNCRFCSGTAPSVCLDCGPGFYLNTQNNQNVCTSCPTNCQTCNAQQCLSCAPGYILDSPLFCRPQCSYPCASCAATPAHVPVVLQVLLSIVKVNALQFLRVLEEYAILVHLDTYFQVIPAFNVLQTLTARDAILQILANATLVLLVLS